jgi:hypothetical protein
MPLEESPSETRRIARSRNRREPPKSREYDANDPVTGMTTTMGTFTCALRFAAVRSPGICAARVAARACRTCV